MIDVDVHKIPMNAPDDMQGLISLIENNIINVQDIVAIIVKTEGNGNVNDFSRGFATYRIQTLLSTYLKCSPYEISKKVSIICSGGCEGVMSPHSTVFIKGNRSNNNHDKMKVISNNEKRLSIGITNTRELLPEEIGTTIHTKEIEKGVRRALLDANINDTRDVHFVQIKCPLLTSNRINDAEKRGKKVVTGDTLKSMGYSRGASALGVAIALGEVDEQRVTDLAICNEWNLYSSVASASAGIELMNNEIMVMGNSKNSSSQCIIGHSVMKDPIDSKGIREALRNAKLLSNNEVTLNEKEKQKLVNVFAKAGAHPSGIVMGRKTTMLTDSDISSTRHVRAVVNAVIASIIGDPMVYVSGGSEHQGPIGGGPVAVIARA